MRKHNTANTKGTTEIRLAAQLCTFLNARGCCVWRHNNAGTFSPAKAEPMVRRIFAVAIQGQWPIETCMKAWKEVVAQSWAKTPSQFPGIFDVVGFDANGKFIAIEVKLGADHLSTEQKEFWKKVQETGATPYLVRDLHVFTQNWREKYAPKHQGYVQQGPKSQPINSYRIGIFQEGT